MSQKLPAKGFKWVKKKKLSEFNEDFIKKYDEDSNTGYFLEVDIDYPKELFNFHKDLPFLPERKKAEKVKKLICSIEDKEKYVIHIRALKQALNHGLKLKRAIRFKQRTWLVRMENVRNHRDIKLITTDKRRKRLVSEPNYHSHKNCSEHLMAIEMKKTRVKMVKPLYLAM